jgi:2-oxoglutarate dehydrogenase E2 component (dihydrolipoamide succinyltransferase)
MLTTFNEVDMSAVMAIRNKEKDNFLKKHGLKLTFMPFFMKACAQALTEFVEVNAYIDGDEIVYNKNVHMGIAVSTPKGLVVPVIRDINTMSLVEMTRNMNALAEKGRDGKLSISDMAGGTFTITNGGVFGSMLSTPILNPPQSAILGLHNIVDRAVVVGGKIEIRPIMYLALSYDHRIIDGKDSVQFLVRVKELVEDPSLFILGA